MNHLHRLQFVSICLLGLALTACATRTSTASAAFPTGSYARGEAVIRLNPDGTTVGTSLSGQDWSKGSYTVKGDTATFTDNWYADITLAPPCIGIAGTYRWTYANQQLRLEPIEDHCQARVNGFRGGAWMRMN